uniref:Uncharacterized protein n=1 Tax=Megaselia scalaris TaxID=36166 RepID=T1GXF7_MEGSC
MENKADAKKTYSTSVEGAREKSIRIKNTILGFWHPCRAVQGSGIRHVTVSYCTNNAFGIIVLWNKYNGTELDA